LCRKKTTGKRCRGGRRGILAPELGLNAKLEPSLSESKAAGWLPSFDDRMPELADALDEAGCTEADILFHCHGPGPPAARLPLGASPV
jgi:hypothetical protein